MGGEKKNCGPPKVAVLLSGCGHLDGTEPSEAISTAIHLNSKGLVANFFAPDVQLCNPVNHLCGRVEEGLHKSAAAEAARLARGRVMPLSECAACHYAALIIPGGLGVSRTLSDFSTKGASCIVLPEVKKVIEEFCCCEKPIGCINLGSALVARTLEGCKVTLGKSCPKDRWLYSESIAHIKEMGACHEEQEVKGVAHCPEYDVYSTPGWMDCKATYADVHEGIGKMIASLARCIKV